MFAQTTPLVSVVIVNYKTPELLLRCIASVFSHSRALPVEVVVVDNFSEDNSLELVRQKFPQVVCVEMSYNSGFARGNNAGLRIAKGKYALLLNSDAFFKSDAINELFNYYRQLEKNNNPGLLGCRIVSESAHLLRGTHVGFPGIKKLVDANPFMIYWRKKQGVNIVDQKEMQIEAQEALHYKNHEADIISGACVFMNLQTLQQHNLFLDEDFFLYSEDVEWSYRYKKRGFKNYFTAETEVVHLDSGSSAVPINKRMQITISEWLFMLKMYGLAYYKTYMLLLGLNLCLDGWLARKANEPSEFTTERTIVKKAWRKYFLYIVTTYYFSKASNKPFLKYEPAD